MNKYERTELLEGMAALVIIAGPFVGLFVLAILSFF